MGAGGGDRAHLSPSCPLPRPSCGVGDIAQSTPKRTRGRQRRWRSRSRPLWSTCRRSSSATHRWHRGIKVRRFVIVGENGVRACENRVWFFLMLTWFCAGLVRVRVADAAVSDASQGYPAVMHVLELFLAALVTYSIICDTNTQIARAASKTVPHECQVEDAEDGKHRRVFSPQDLVGCRVVCGRRCRR